MIVLDCSYAIAMVLPDENRPVSLTRTLSARVMAPSIWPLEVANALRNSVRRGRLAPARVAGICADLEAYEVELVPAPEGGVLRRYEAAQRHDVTPYDAAYIELALERHCMLATLDSRLAAVAEQAGLQVLS